MYSDRTPELISPLHHDEFLPPISNWMKVGGLFLVSTVGVAIAVCAVTPLPVTVKAQGIVRPNGEVKIVQASTEGVVTAISGKVNQKVEEGDTIAILNDSRLESKKQQLKVNIEQNLLQIKILEEQIQFLNNQIVAEKNRLDRGVTSAKADLQRITADLQEKTKLLKPKLPKPKLIYKLINENYKKIKRN